jgi:hypothetical protein
MGKESTGQLSPGCCSRAGLEQLQVVTKQKVVGICKGTVVLIAQAIDSVDSNFKLYSLKLEHEAHHTDSVQQSIEYYLKFRVTISYQISWKILPPNPLRVLVESTSRVSPTHYPS